MKMSDIIAVIAIVVSIGNVVFQLAFEKYQIEKERKTAIYKEAYKVCFFDEIPLAKQKVIYDGKKMTGLQEIEDVIRKIRLKSYFFEYIDNGFRKEIFEESQKTEDFLLSLEDIEMDHEKYRQNYETLENHLNSMYRIVTMKMFP